MKNTIKIKRHFLRGTRFSDGIIITNLKPTDTVLLHTDFLLFERVRKEMEKEYSEKLGCRVIILENSISVAKVLENNQNNWGKTI